MFFTTILTSKQIFFFFSEQELKMALHETLTRAAWLGPSNVWWCSVLVHSEHAHASYPGLFFRPPGFSSYMGREKSRVQGLDYTLTRRHFRKPHMQLTQYGRTNVASPANKLHTLGSRFLNSVSRLVVPKNKWNNNVIHKSHTLWLAW